MAWSSALACGGEVRFFPGAVSRIRHELFCLQMGVAPGTEDSLCPRANRGALFDSSVAGPAQDDAHRRAQTFRHGLALSAHDWSLGGLPSEHPVHIWLAQTLRHGLACVYWPC